MAVVAVLHTLGAPPKLAAIIEGESLLNDGTAFVSYLICAKVVSGTDLSAADGIVLFVRLAFGGIALGYVFGVIASYWLRKFADAAIEITILIISVFSIFFFAEHICGVSGVLSTVVFGVFISKQREWSLSRAVIHQNHVVWSELGFLANTVIFTMGGVIIYGHFADDDVLKGVISEPTAELPWPRPVSPSGSPAWRRCLRQCSPPRDR